MKNLLYTEYGIELLECFINELSKIDKGVADLFRPPHKLVTNDIKKEKAAILAAESDTIKYNAARRRLETALTEGKEQLKEMLDTQKILAILNKE